MFKLSRTAWLVLGIGLLIVLFGVLGMNDIGQSRERESLAEEQVQAELALREVTIAKRVEEQAKQEVEERVAQAEVGLQLAEAELDNAESKLRVSQASFPRSVETIDVVEELFAISERLGLEVIELTSSEPSEEEVEGVNYLLYYFTIEVEGELIDILGFISAISRDDDFTAATLDVAGIEVPVPEILDVGEEAEPATASIGLVFYVYQGG